MDATTKAVSAAWIAVTHWWPHIDELLGVWLTLSERFRRAAERKFPGIVSSPSAIQLEYWKKGNEVPEWATSCDRVRRMRRIPVGIWRGVSLYDEHASAGFAGSPGECAADLMAQQLRISDEPRLTPLLAAVRENDVRGSGGRFGLGALVKALHEARPAEGSFVAQLAFDAFDAVVTAEEAKISGKPLLEFDAAKFGEKIAGHDRGLAAIWDEAAREEKARPRYLSLIALVRAITACKSDAVAVDWALHALCALRENVEIFEQACADVKKSARVWTKKSGGRDVIVALAASDSPAALRAMKRLVNSQPAAASKIAAAKNRGSIFTQAAVMIACRPTGNIVVQAQGGPTLVLVAIALRAAEAKKREWEIGDPRLFTAWHYMKELECCFNGSNTSPDVEPTALSGDEIVKIVTDCLAPVPARG